jgi:preprotein translocase, SecE subunit, bacterial
MNILNYFKETFQKVIKILTNLPEFFEGVKEEINRLSWPDWNSIVVGTVGVISISIFTTIFVWVSDLIISRIFLMIVGG